MHRSIILSPGAQEATLAAHLWFIPPSAIQMFPINHDHQWFNLLVSFKYFIDRKKNTTTPKIISTMKAQNPFETCIVS